MRKEEKIYKILESKLSTLEMQEKYLNLLNFKIEENRKSMGGLAIIMILLFLAFPLLIQTKISEISVGPFKLLDNTFAISIIPSVFAFCYYKYIMIWVDLSEQKNIYKCLTSKIFDIEYKSYLNIRLRSFSLIDSIENYNNNNQKTTPFGCLVDLIYLPVIIAIILMPYFFEYYCANFLFHKYGINSILNFIFFFSPIVLGLCTISIFFQVGKKDIYEL
ncbi:hypothetical protein DOS84_16600 [Flavobacterium aquariorum]|uniref:Uncharacterized protein n=1 Tax=Flavobacterium aquariorum TaxID=2217670 RepID=A0A2W7TNW6_9FLAO|nr:hypothetical protein [Flavobacterium aquariorum]PZX92163.1 hypothetical protein DOS84_16600 [Flavobacterium aquariorum]